MHLLKFLYVFLCLTILTSYTSAQNSVVKGTVLNEAGEPLAGAYIELDSATIGVSQIDGSYRVSVPCCVPVTIKIKYFGYSASPQSFTLKENEVVLYDFVVRQLAIQTKNITIESYRQTDTMSYNSIDIDPIAPKFLPSAFGDFTKVLPSMALGVSSNSELSSQYSVRGGNYDENLIYINDIELYKPQLVQAGQQEGLSFVNPDLIRKVRFSAGGWESKYGDKLSSVLNADYKTPVRFAGSFTAGLLGGATHIEGISKNNRVSFVSGARLKSSKYLLNTLETKGEYKPVFWDWQTFATYDLTRKSDIQYNPAATKLELLFIVSQNKYQVTPSTRQTNFGTLDNPMQFDVAFDGRDILTYKTIQGGLRFSHKVNNRFKTSLGLNSAYSTEREYFDVESGYRISDVEPDPSLPSYNQNVVTKGVGSYFDHGRNLLNIQIHTLSNRNVYYVSSRGTLEFGVSYQHERINDHYDEYSFSDSASYVTLNRSVYSTAHLISHRIQGYVQYKYTVDSTHIFVPGIRFQYWSLNDQTLISPRFQYVYNPRNNKSVSFRIGTGIYQQAAFYREMRALDGSVNTNIKAQRSFQFIVGMDKTLNSWGRKFTLVTEAYVKYIDRIVPYDLYDVRIRYYGKNCGTAYATGIDFRLNGEFVKGVESWFNLGILTTKEDIDGDGRGYIRRPTDQRVTAAIFFQDHLPNNPTIKVYVNLIFGSGLPFGPPNQPQFRSALNAPAYKRVDIGFSKLISFTDKDVSKKRFVESVWISAEVLNLLGTPNTISYLWVPDYSNNYYAIPNTLSARFLNLKTIVRF